MPQGKDRLYIALYVRGSPPKMPGKEDTYHWSFMVGPKVEAQGGHGWRYHAKERLKEGGRSEWFFEERECPFSPTAMILVRVMIAKVEDGEALLKVIRNNPIRQEQQGWNCVHWIKEALGKLDGDKKALGKRVADWGKVRDTVMTYCQRKKDGHRFDGKSQYDMSKIPTYNLVEGKEVVP